MMLCDLAIIGRSNARCCIAITSYSAVPIRGIWMMRMTVSSIVEQRTDAIHAALYNNAYRCYYTGLIVTFIAHRCGNRAVRHTVRSSVYISQQLSGNAGLVSLASATSSSASSSPLLKNLWTTSRCCVLLLASSYCLPVTYSYHVHSLTIWLSTSLL